MWVILNEALVRYSDDAPVPAEAVRVDVPDDFQTNPQRYKLSGASLVKRTQKELREMARAKEQATLTADEISLIKKAIKEGRI
jgi:hypothetical protein